MNAQAQNSQQPSLKSLITTPAAQREIAKALPDHITTDRFTRAVLTAINRTPKLAQCSQSSFLEAMMTCSQLGLEPNGYDAHLVPYGTKCTLIADYKGLIKLAYQSGSVTNIEAAVVYDGDEFDYETCKHKPWGWIAGSKRLKHRGNPIGAYVIIHMKDGAIHRERMTTDEINAIRDRSPAGQSGPWVTDWDEMAKKTVYKRAAKWVPKSPHLQQALLVDDDASIASSEPATEALLEMPSMSDSIMSSVADQREELPHYPSDPVAKPSAKKDDQESVVESVPTAKQESDKETQAEKIRRWSRCLRTSDTHEDLIGCLAELDDDQTLTDASKKRLAAIANKRMDEIQEEETENESSDESAPKQGQLID